MCIQHSHTCNTHPHFPCRWCPEWAAASAVAVAGISMDFLDLYFVVFNKLWSTLITELYNIAFNID
jgi:hypothetical protein